MTAPRLLICARALVASWLLISIAAIAETTTTPSSSPIPMPTIPLAATSATAGPTRTASRSKVTSEPDPNASDPSLLLEIPEPVVPKPKKAPPLPVPTAMPRQVAIPRPMPAAAPAPPVPTISAAIPAPQVQIRQPTFSPAGDPSPTRMIRFDKPVDSNLSLPINSEVSIILSNNKFFPSKVKLREGMPAKLFFTTVNKKPGALIIERLQVQRWIAKERPAGQSEADRARWESSHEINSNRITEVIMEPKSGTYNFHDALTGATGEITVDN